jgi:cysteinyl-tRNA synthetase
MTLQLYDSLTRKKEAFVPVDPGKVKMYVCGMTVYSDAHIGHARTYFSFDMIKRYLEYKGYDVLYVQNVTDVDDKIINAANKQCVDALVYSCECTERCIGALDELGIQRADLYPKASETIDDMIVMIQQLLEKGYAYEASGDVYFSVEKFPEYGKLSGQNIEELESGIRIEPGDKKQSPLDCALWKQAKPGEPSWPSPWGDGRPGWHIECSTMSAKYLGLPFDIHGGGMDLRFPHHENEIAQAEAATGKPFANYWLHSGLLTVNGEKMSKSIGNIINIKDLLNKWPAEVIRLFFAKTHYRRPPDFSIDALKDAEKGLNRIHRFKEQLESMGDRNECVIQPEHLSNMDRELFDITTSFQMEFDQAMDDDFNSPKAIAALFEYITQVNSYLSTHDPPGKEVIWFCLDTLVKLGKILTLFQDETKTGVENIEAVKELYSTYVPDKKPSDDVDALLHELLMVREHARKNKEWAMADAIRDSIECLGYEVQDTADGPVCRKRR